MLEHNHLKPLQEYHQRNGINHDLVADIVTLRISNPCITVQPKTSIQSTVNIQQPPMGEWMQYIRSSLNERRAA